MKNVNVKTMLSQTGRGVQRLFRLFLCFNTNLCRKGVVAMQKCSIEQRLLKIIRREEGGGFRVDKT